MSKLVVETRNLTKVYHLYQDPLYRALDRFGLTKKMAEGHYQKLAAVQDVNLSIRRGSRVAIIGQNGAGKTTLLKLISGHLEPTSGTVKVHGKVSAIFQIGTGFHPNMTGRRNLQSALTYQGRTGKDSGAIIDEIIEFTELGMFIDQPISTYSRGMSMRLSFASSIFLTPDILILDEVLAVGDSYFNRKCRQKMEEMTASETTTLLLVTHNLGLARTFCNDFLWMKSGEIHMSGSYLEVAGAYEEDTKLREEERLRRLNQPKSPPQNSSGDRMHSFWGEIVQELNHPLTGKLLVSRIDIKRGSEIVHSIPMEPGSESGNAILLDPETSSWGELESIDGFACRSFSNNGNVFHKAPFQFDLSNTIEAGELTVSVRCKDTCPDRILIRWGNSADSVHKTSWIQMQEDGLWKTVDFPLANAALETETSKPSAAVEPDSDQVGLGRLPSLKRYGNGKILITDVQLLDKNNEPKWVFDLLEPMTMAIHYEVVNEKLPASFHVALSTLNDQGLKSINPTTLGPGKITIKKPKGVIKFKMDSCLLNRGDYTLSLALFAELSKNNDDEFYTVNRDIYDFQVYAYHFKIFGGFATEQGIYYQPGHWEVVE